MSKIEEILNYLKNRKGEPIRLIPLSKELKSPTSTVSAAIHSLREKGHHITCDRLNGGYVYHEKPPVGESTSPHTSSSVPSSVRNGTTSHTAQIIQYMMEKKRVTPQQLLDDLKIKRSSLYAFISQIRRHHKIYMKKGVYYYSGAKSFEKKGVPDSLAENFPWISMSDIMKVPEQERVEMFEAMRKELFYRKIALAFVDATKIAESTIKGVQI